MTEDELQILRSFLMTQHLESLKDGSPYKYLQIKVIGGKRKDVEKLVNILSRLFSTRSSRIHQCSLDIDPEVKVVNYREHRCWRCYLKIYLPERPDEDLANSYEETIKSLKTEIGDLQATIGELHSRIERLTLHR